MINNKLHLMHTKITDRHVYIPSSLHFPFCVPLCDLFLITQLFRAKNKLRNLLIMSSGNRKIIFKFHPVFFCLTY